MSNPIHPTIPAKLGGDMAFASLIRDTLGHMFPVNSIRLAADDSGTWIICENDEGGEWSLAVYRGDKGGRA